MVFVSIAEILVEVVTCVYPAALMDAIAQNPEGVTVDSFKCEECGACVAACPTGALQNERFNDASFVDYFRDVTLPQDGTVVIGNEKSLHNLWWRQQGKRYEKIFFLQYSTCAKPVSVSFHVFTEPGCETDCGFAK